MFTRKGVSIHIQLMYMMVKSSYQWCSWETTASVVKLLIGLNGTVQLQSCTADVDGRLRYFQTTKKTIH